MTSITKYLRVRTPDIDYVDYTTARTQVRWYPEGATLPSGYGPVEMDGGVDYYETVTETSGTYATSYQLPAGVYETIGIDEVHTHGDGWFGVGYFKEVDGDVNTWVTRILEVEASNIDDETLRHRWECEGPCPRATSALIHLNPHLQISDGGPVTLDKTWVYRMWVTFGSLASAGYLSHVNETLIVCGDGA